MELKEFISQTLTQIIGGVQEARKQVKGMNGEVAPFLTHDTIPKGDQGVLSGGGGYAEAIHLVDFDIALTVEEVTESKHGVGALITVFGAGMQSAQNSSNTHLSRVKFTVPIQYMSKRGTGL